MRAHTAHRFPNAEAFEQADRRRADRRNTHIRRRSGIKGRRRVFFYHRYRKPVLRQPQRQRAADHSAADDGDICCMNCHGNYP